MVRGEAAGPTSGPTPTLRVDGDRQRCWWQFPVAYGVYQVLALLVWWHLLGRFGSALPTGSADPAQEVWFLAWVPHAIGSGVNPFFSHALFAPGGVNLLSNTSVELLGLVLSPVTVTAGPVAALDVSVLLAPALSALGAFALCRRYVTWRPAAFVGGLCYGFGPFLATDLRFAHVDLTLLVLPPLVFLALDDLLVHRQRRPAAVGTVLGVLVVAQFFVSTEMLAITALMAGVAAVVFAVARPRAVLTAARAAAPGIAVSLAIVGTALAYPVWVVVAGPRHITGAVWPHVGEIASSLAATVEPHAELAGVAFVSGGNGSYLGVPLLAVLAAGALWLWRSPALRVALVLAVIAFVVSLGYDLHVGKERLAVALPAAVLGHVPLLESIVPERFGAMVDLFAGVALAVVVDHVRRWARPASVVRAEHGEGDASGAALVPLGAVSPLPLLLAVAIAAFALVPLGFAARWPYATATVRAPGALGTPILAGRRVPPVVAIYPSSPDAAAAEMAAQAHDGFTFAMPDGYAIVPGPGGRAAESPPGNALWLVFAAGSVRRLALPLTATTRRAVRADLRSMHVRDVLVLPGLAGSGRVRAAVASVLGHPSRTVVGAALWQLGTGRAGRKVRTGDEDRPLRPGARVMSGSVIAGTVQR